MKLILATVALTTFLATSANAATYQLLLEHDSDVSGLTDLSMAEQYSASAAA